jgi:6-phosphogluconolactonase
MVGVAVSPEQRTFASPQALARGVADWLCALALANDRELAFCLSGGSTPRHLYERLAEPAIASRFPWRRVHWFWGDERFVPHDHSDSNYRMAHDAFLAHAPVPRRHIHEIRTVSLSPVEAAAGYEATLKRFYGADQLDLRQPIFDVTLLGIGDNGHTASLFPGHPALDERQRWALAVFGVAPEARITLTYPVLNSSRDVAFIVTGAAKRRIVGRAQAGDPTLPAAGIRPIGRLHWFVDRAAAPE